MWLPCYTDHGEALILSGGTQLSLTFQPSLLRHQTFKWICLKLQPSPVTSWIHWVIPVVPQELRIFPVEKKPCQSFQPNKIRRQCKCCFKPLCWGEPCSAAINNWKRLYEGAYLHFNIRYEHRCNNSKQIICKWSSVKYKKRTYCDQIGFFQICKSVYY